MKLLLYGDGGACRASDERRRRGPSVQRTDASDPLPETEPQPEVIAQLAQEVYANDILQLLVLHIWRFEFEVRPCMHACGYRAKLTLVGRAQARKDVSQIFNNLLRRQIGQRWPTVEYLSQKEETIFAALKGCGIRLPCLPLPALG